jgi:hypothetical protein
MPDEIPTANRPLTAEEQAVIAKLSDADFQVIDAAILANCMDRWLKVVRVVIGAEEVLKSRYPGISYVFYAQRLCRLVDEGHLDAQGDVQYMRFSEVRLPE